MIDLDADFFFPGPSSVISYPEFRDNDAVVADHLRHQEHGAEAEIIPIGRKAVAEK